MCFVWISEQTAIISLYNINRLVFITQTQCVYCAVRAGSLYIIQFNLESLKVKLCFSFHYIAACWQCTEINNEWMNEWTYERRWRHGDVSVHTGIASSLLIRKYNCEKTRQAAWLPLPGVLGEAWQAANCRTERHTVISGRRTLGTAEGRKEGRTSRCGAALDTRNAWTTGFVLFICGISEESLTTVLLSEGLAVFCLVFRP